MANTRYYLGSEKECVNAVEQLNTLFKNIKFVLPSEGEAGPWKVKAEKDGYLLKPMAKVVFLGRDLEKALEFVVFLEKQGITAIIKQRSEKGRVYDLSIDDANIFLKIDDIVKTLASKIESLEKEPREKREKISHHGFKKPIIGKERTVIIDPESWKKEAEIEDRKKAEIKVQGWSKDKGWIIEDPEVLRQRNKDYRAYLRDLKERLDNDKWNTMGKDFLGKDIIPKHIDALRNAVKDLDSFDNRQVADVYHNQVVKIINEIDLKEKRHPELTKLYKQLKYEIKLGPEKFALSKHETAIKKIS